MFCSRRYRCGHGKLIRVLPGIHISSNNKGNQSHGRHARETRGPDRAMSAQTYAAEGGGRGFADTRHNVGDKGPAVLSIHGGVQGGLGGGPINFAGQKPLSEEGWLLKLADRPGFGQSPSRGPDDQESDALWIAEKLGDGSHLIGHSFGGAEALLAAAHRPQAVRSLILIEPALQPMILTDPDSMKNPEARAALQMMGQFFVTARTPAEFATLFAGSLGKGEDGGLNPSLAALAESSEKATTLGCALLQAQMASPAAMRQAAEIVAHAHIPVLVISGGYSPAQDETAEIVAKLTHGRHVIVSSPNHFVQQMNPKEFNRVVNDFMSDADRGRVKQ